VEDTGEFLNIIDTASNTVVAHILQPIFHGSLTITSDGTRIYVAAPTSTTVSIIDTSTNAVVNTIPLGNNSPTDSALTPDGARLYITNVLNTVSVIDTATNTLVTTIPNIACPETSAHRIAIAEVPQVPKTKNDCKDGGYMEFGPPAGPFRNQGQCIRYVEAHSQ